MAKEFVQVFSFQDVSSLVVDVSTKIFKVLMLENHLPKKFMRMKLNQQLYNEAYYSVYAKDYKTYGWMTW